MKWNNRFDILGKATGSATAGSGVLTGSISPGSVWAVDFICTLPAPKGVGGLNVGSWQYFPVEIMLSGGWGINSNGSEVKQKIIVLLRTFISL